MIDDVENLTNREEIRRRLSILRLCRTAILMAAVWQWFTSTLVVDRTCEEHKRGMLTSCLR